MLRRTGRGPTVTVDTAAIATAVAKEVPTLAEVQALLQPSNGPYTTGELTGASSYVILAMQSNAAVALYGFTVSSDVACTVGWWSGNMTSMSDTHPLAASGNWTLSPGAEKSFTTNLEEALVLKCSSVIAKLRVTYWAAYI